MTNKTVPHLEIAQRYWNEIVPKYGDKAPGRVRWRPGNSVNWNTDAAWHPAFSPSFEYEILPDTIKIGGREVVRGLTVEPEAGCVVWQASANHSTFCLRVEYGVYYRHLFERGLLFDNESDARAMGEALAALLQGGE